MLPLAIHECISTLYPARTAEEEVTEQALNTILH